jgi:hypothetical protein
MSDSDTSIPQKVADLANALGAVRRHIGARSGLSRSFHSWFRANGSDAKPWDPNQREKLKHFLEDVAEYVEAVDTANRMLNTVPDSVLKLLSGLTGAVRWDVHTLRTLRMIQRETSFLRSHSRDPKMLYSVLLSMGKDGFMEMQSRLEEFEFELADRIFNLQCIPDALSGQTKPISGQPGAHQVPVANSNENTKSDGDSIKPSSEQENSTETDETLPKKIRKNSPSRVKAMAAYDYAIQQIPNADKMTAVELFDAICNDGEAKEMLPPSAESFTKYLNDCGIRLRKSDTKPTGRSVVRRSDT